MNRKKKIYTTLKKKYKKANAKQQHSNKPKYISKAEREKLATDVETATASPEQAPAAMSQDDPISGL